MMSPLFRRLLDGDVIRHTDQIRRARVHPFDAAPEWVGVDQRLVGLVVGCDASTAGMEFRRMLTPDAEPT